MHVYKRKDSKYYWYKFEYHGAVYRGSTGVRAKPAARDIAAKVRVDVIEGRYGIERQKTAPLFKDAMAQFIHHTRQHNAAGTAKRYDCSAKPLNKAFGKKRLDAVTAEAIGKYKTARLGEKLKPATINAELACMKAMFNHHAAWKNPAAKMKMLPEGNQKTRVVSPEEERLYLAACAQPLADIAVLMVETGMRPEEIYRMKSENVSLVAGYVFNPYGKTKAARRKLALTRRATDALRGRLSGDYAFPHPDTPTRPMGKANALHDAALKRSGVAHFRLYDLRHTFATRAAEAGVDLVTLAALMGHSKIQMVLRYAHPTEEHQAQAIRKMEEFQLGKQMEEESRSELIQ